MSFNLGFWHTVRREMRRITSRPLYIVTGVLMPIILALFMLSFMGAGLPTRVPCAVVDLDNTDLSREMVRTLGTMSNCDVKHKVESYSEAMQLVRSQEIYGFFVIPENFADDALAFRQPEISLYSNYVFFIPGTLLYKGMLTTATLAKAGMTQKIMLAAGLSDSQIRTTLSPVTVHTHPLNNPWLNYNIYLSNSFVPCILALMILLVTCHAVTMEIKHGTSVQWLEGAHGSMLIALLGKLLPYTVAFFITGMAIDAMMYGINAFPLNCSVALLMLNMLLLVMACQAFAVFIAMVIPNPRFALSICSLIGILSFSIGGFSYPTEQMYRSIEIFSYIIPIRYYFLIYIDQVLNGIDLYFSRYYYAALLAFLLLPFTLGRRLKRACLNPVYIP